MGLLYDAVALGMLAFSRTAFRVRVLGPSRFTFSPSTIIVSTHRRETDVPIVCPPLYFRARLWKHRDELARMSFAARDDMFLRGFFAGFPAGLSPRVRRLLYPIGVARFLPVVQVHPIRSAEVARLGEVLEAAAEAPLAELAPDGLVASLETRAAECRLPRPRLAGDVLRGEYADLLWQVVTRADVAAGHDEIWGARTARAAADFRELVELVRAGGTLVVFPEGRPSPDGTIGPLRRGLGGLVRRAHPSVVFPLALAYDPLVRGRTIVFLALGAQVEPPSGDVEAELLALLRRTMPLTCGQVVASRLVSGEKTSAADAAVADAVGEARAEGRSFDPELADPERRRRRVAEALAAARARAGELEFLAREYESARASP